MKYWRGYLTAAILAAITIALSQFAKAHTTLVDMIYPYATRLIQTSLAQWTSGADFLLWQLLAVVLGVLLLASIVIMIVLKWNPIQWFGWVLTGACLLAFLHTGIYGMNSHAGPLADDIRLNVTEYTVTELAEATRYFRDIANQLSDQMPRNSDGTLDFPSFDELALQAGEGFETLTYDYQLSVFAGSTLPVKRLGWADMYTSMGITGFTMSLTGEAAVNPKIPVIELPFTMCHEMAHRMCIAQERDANLAGFLACQVNSDPIHRYSGYFMAFRYCYNALASVGTSTANNAAKEIYQGISPNLQKDLADYRAFYAAEKDDQASDFANTVNDAYIKANGDESGIHSYGEVCDLLVSWHIQEIYLPAHKDEEEVFDPFDKSQVDLSGIPNAEGK